MDTFIDLVEAVTDDSRLSSNSSYITQAKVKKAINRSQIWAGTLYEWASLENAKLFNTVANQYYYDYPTTFKDDSIYMMEINGEPYYKKNYEDFIAYKRNHPNNEEKVRLFSSLNRQFFIFPTPTATGSSNGSIWGNDNAKIIPMVADTDKSIFSDHNTQGNIAIVKYAVSILAPRKKDDRKGMLEEPTAEKILTNMWLKVISKRQREQRIEHTKFKVPNFFGGNYVTRSENTF